MKIIKVYKKYFKESFDTDPLKDKAFEWLSFYISTSQTASPSKDIIKFF